MKDLKNLLRIGFFGLLFFAFQLQLDAQLYQLVRYEPLIYISDRHDANATLRRLDDYNAQYTTVVEGVQYSFGFSWAPPDPQTVYDGDKVGIQLNPKVIEMGKYMIGCSMDTYVEGITNGNRKLESGSAGAGRSGQTGQLYEIPGKALYVMSKADETDIVITVYGGAANDKIEFGKFHFRKVGGPIIGGNIVLNTPVTSQNVWWGNQYWMGITLPGHIRLSQGQQLILVARFYNYDGMQLVGTDPQFTDSNGYVAAAIQVDAIPSNDYMTDNLTLYIPYKALGLGYDRNQIQYSLKYFVEVLINGKSSAVSDWESFGVMW